MIWFRSLGPVRKLKVRDRYYRGLHAHRIMTEIDCEIMVRLPIAFAFTYREMDRRDFYSMRGRMYARIAAQK